MLPTETPGGNETTTMAPTETPGGNATTTMPPTESPAKKRVRCFRLNKITRLIRSRIAETISFKNVLKV